MEAKPQHGSAFILLFSKYGFRVCSVKATDSGAGQKVEEKKNLKICSLSRNYTLVGKEKNNKQNI